MFLAGSAQAGVVSISGEFRGGLIFVHAAVGNGPPGCFLLDTGAAVTILDATFAGQARLTLGDPVTLRGGGTIPGRQAENVALRLAGEPDLRTDPLVADLSQASQGMDVRLDGILGDDILRRFVVTLDYGRGEIRLTSASEVVPPPDAIAMRLIATPFIVATVEDQGKVQDAVFQIDTGSNTAIEFWAPFARSMLPQSPTTPGARLGVAGENRTERGQITALTVAGRRIVDLQANFADRLKADDAGLGYGGVIGGPAWMGRVLTLDFPHQRVWVR